MASRGPSAQHTRQSMAIRSLRSPPARCRNRQTCFSSERLLLTSRRRQSFEPSAQQPDFPATHLSGTFREVSAERCLSCPYWFVGTVPWVPFLLEIYCRENLPARPLVQNPGARNAGRYRLCPDKPIRPLGTSLHSGGRGSTDCWTQHCCYLGLATRLPLDRAWNAVFCRSP